MPLVAESECRYQSVKKIAQQIQTKYFMGGRHYWSLTRICKKNSDILHFHLWPPCNRTIPNCPENNAHHSFCHDMMMGTNCWPILSCLIYMVRVMIKQWSLSLSTTTFINCTSCNFMKSSSEVKWVQHVYSYHYGSELGFIYVRSKRVNCYQLWQRQILTPFCLHYTVPKKSPAMAAC